MAYFKRTFLKFEIRYPFTANTSRRRKDVVDGIGKHQIHPDQPHEANHSQSDLQALLDLHNWRNDVGKVKANLKKDDNALRLGIISAAAINYAAIIDPVQTHPGVVVVGIAARQLAKAQAQVDKYSLGPTCKAYGSYAELLADTSIEAVYIPLPNGLHCEWAIKAMEAGKHVLVEKPIASNADEVRRIQETAKRTDRIVLEAFHWLFHPAAHTVRSIIDSGEYGAPTSTYTRFILPNFVLSKDDIRFQYALAGGTCMDLTYVFSASTQWARFTPEDTCTFDVQQATPRINQRDAKIDEAMNSTFVVERPGRPAVTCKVEADAKNPGLWGLVPRLWASTPITSVELERARIEFNGFVLPTFGHSIVITEKDENRKLTKRKHTETCFVDGPEWKSRGQTWWSTYRYQLEAFVSKIRAEETGAEYVGPWFSMDESRKLMELIDSVYDKAGLPRRGTA